MNNFNQKNNIIKHNDILGQCDEEQKEQKKSKKKKKNKIPKRCQYAECNKKLSLVDKQYKCKCEKYFCILHKSYSKHNCDYDYKKTYQENKNTLINKMKIVNEHYVKL